ncbi:MAG: hypothetical protein M3Q75_14545 [Gemmatimonadota bacterium]|nr:hypothetical protein [Gemmatimonadota bacterium]
MTKRKTKTIAHFPLIDARPGSIIETVYTRIYGSPTPSGKYYYLARYNRLTERVEAYQAHRQGKTTLHPTLHARYITIDELNASPETFQF